MAALLSGRVGSVDSAKIVKAVSRSELAVERAILPRIDKQAFYPQVRHGGVDKTFSVSGPPVPTAHAAYIRYGGSVYFPAAP